MVTFEYESEIIFISRHLAQAMLQSASSLLSPKLPSPGCVKLAYINTKWAVYFLISLILLNVVGTRDQQRINYIPADKFQSPWIAPISNPNGRNKNCMKFALLWRVNGIQWWLHSYIRFLFKRVGNIMTEPIRKRTTKVLKSYRSLTDLKSPRARPAWLFKWWKQEKLSDSFERNKF